MLCLSHVILDMNLNDSCSALPRSDADPEQTCGTNTLHLTQRLVIQTELDITKIPAMLPLRKHLNSTGHAAYDRRLR